SYYANPIIENVVVTFADSDSLNSGFYFEGSNPQCPNAKLPIGRGILKTTEFMTLFPKLRPMFSRKPVCMM
ncbi:MAG: hypothetical protein B6D62_01765, partial [Candidatus Cloacimonas sp. 4484_275]